VVLILRGRTLRTLILKILVAGVIPLRLEVVVMVL
jgi:hypothetical protein